MPLNKISEFNQEYQALDKNILHSKTILVKITISFKTTEMLK